MASPARLRVPPRVPAPEGGTRGDGAEESSRYSSDDAPAGEEYSPDSASASESSSPGTKGPPAAKVKTTRTRTVKSRAIFTPEDDSEKKPRGRGGKPGKRGYRKRGLKDLLGDEEAQQPEEASADGAGGASSGDGAGSGSGAGAGAGDGAGSGSGYWDALRKRSRNQSDGENRWDRIRAKVRVSLTKIRRDTHFLQVYERDGWKSSGREKLKPTAELLKATKRLRGVKTELRELTKGLTGMNSGGSRWGALQEDPEGLIEVAEIMCTKCNRGDSDDNDDILLCDYAGCFRAYHQNCLFPPIKPEAFPGEEEDWFCWQCECLADCLEILEKEFQTKFASWEDVFPDVEEDAEEAGTGAEGQGEVVLADSDGSDDPNDLSFKGSSSESDEEEEEGEGEPGETSSDGEGKGSGKGEDVGDTSNLDTSEDDDKSWMSDAESVGSDEVAKLHSEAGDFADSDSGGDVGLGGGSSKAGCSSKTAGSRGSRALERRVKRNVYLGLPDDGMAEAQQEKRAIAAALEGNGKIDPANIRGRRTRGKRSVDYVKLNETVFGDESVDGDQLSSDAKDHESSEASASESDGSSFSVKASRPPARPKLPSIDPLTGQKRKRGRPRKDLAGSATAASWGKPSIDPATGEKRKRGRPRKNPATGEKRKRGRPRKTKDDAESVESDAGEVAVKRKPGRPRKVDCDDGASAGSAVDNGTPKRKRGRPKKLVTVSENGSENGTEKRKQGRPRKDGSVPKASHVGPEKGEASGKRRGRGRPRKQVEEGKDAGGAASDATINSAAGSSPVAGVKRGRGRPRKSPPASPAAVVENKGDDPSAAGDEAVVENQGDDPSAAGDEAVVENKGDDPSAAGGEVESAA